MPKYQHCPHCSSTTIIKKARNPVGRNMCANHAVSISRVKEKQTERRPL